MNRRRQRSGSVAGLLVASAIVVGTAGCADDGGTIAGERGTGGSASAPAHVQRAQAIEMAVARWGRATPLAGARAGAEEARNLITGPTVPGAGDADGNGRQRRVRVGLLPGADGSPGLASTVRGACVRQDVLGGDWGRPKARWNGVLERIDAWSPESNRFPELPSHAQRTVGWASLTLRAMTLEEAREYCGHARGHAAIVTAALEAPGARPCPGG